MFSLSQTKLEMHENLITCIIFCKQDCIHVGDSKTDIKAPIVCIKPNVEHWVLIPESGAEILYLDGVKLHHDFDNFQTLSNDWQSIPESFYNEEHQAIESFRTFLNRDTEMPNQPILDVIEALYTTPLNRMTQDELAAKLGLERTLALKYFKSVTGQTFRRFKKWAASVTVTASVFNGEIIGHAGIDAGFADAAHTSRTAKELFGLTPTDGVGSLRGISTLVKPNKS